MNEFFLEYELEVHVANYIFEEEYSDIMNSLSLGIVTEAEGAVSKVFKSVKDFFVRLISSIRTLIDKVLGKTAEATKQSKMDEKYENLMNALHNGTIKSSGSVKVFNIDKYMKAYESYTKATVSGLKEILKKNYASEADFRKDVDKIDAQLKKIWGSLKLAGENNFEESIPVGTAIKNGREGSKNVERQIRELQNKWAKQINELSLMLDESQPPYKAKYLQKMSNEISGGFSAQLKRAAKNPATYLAAIMAVVGARYAVKGAAVTAGTIKAAKVAGKVSPDLSKNIMKDLGKNIKDATIGADIEKGKQLYNKIANSVGAKKNDKGKKNLLKQMADSVRSSMQADGLDYDKDASARKKYEADWKRNSKAWKALT